MKYTILLFIGLIGIAYGAPLKQEFLDSGDIESKVEFKVESNRVVNSFSTISAHKAGSYSTKGLLQDSSMQWRVDIESVVLSDSKEGYIKVKVVNLKSDSDKEKVIFETQLTHKGFGVYRVLTKNGVILELTLSKPKKS